MIDKIFLKWLKYFKILKELGPSSYMSEET